MSNSPSREDILYSFSVEPSHDRDTLERYLRLYPDHSEDLVDLSSALRISQMVRPRAENRLPDPKASEAWQALVACTPPAGEENAQSQTTLNLKGHALIDVANKLNIPRSLVTALRDRLAEPSSIPMRFISRLAVVTGSSIKAIQQYLAQPPVTSSALQFKSDVQPKNQGQVSFRKLVDDTPMPDEQRQALLRDWVENGQD